MADNSTSAAGHGQCLPKTSSRCVVASVTATHDFEVTNFSLLDGMGIGKFVTSSTFSAGGRDWNFRLYPDGCEERNKAAYVSVYLIFLQGLVGARVKFSLSLLGKDDGVLKLLKDTHTFDSVGVGRGWAKCMEKSKLQQFLRLNNDSFTIRCILTVIKEPQAEEVKAIIEVPQSNLHKHFEHMLKNGKGTDVTFSVDGQLFHAHRCVLAARSPVFEAELLGPMKKKPIQHIEIDDMEPSIFEALLHFIYTDSLSDSCNGDENVTMQHLLVAADRYGLDRLKLMCEANLCRGIDVNTVATTLTLAEQHNRAHLKDACLAYITSRDILGDVMKTDGFEHLMASCPLVMKEILDKIAVAKNE